MIRLRPYAHRPSLRKDSKNTGLVDGFSNSKGIGVVFGKLVEAPFNLTIFGERDAYENIGRVEMVT